jgi:DNA-binding transcriptional MerR regulator
VTGTGTAGTAGGEYRIEDLAQHSGATVRTIRAYQDRGLLPRPGRRGRANVYDDSHLTRLRQIAGLLERGYTLASIKELLEAWDEGRGLGGVLGLLSEVEGPWTDEEPEHLSRAQLNDLFGDGPLSGDVRGGSGDRGDRAQNDDAVAEAVELGVLVPLPDQPGHFIVPSPQELAVAAELHRAGVPLLAITEHLRELRAQVEHIAARFMDLTNEHIFVRYLHDHPSDEDASEAAGLVRRLRPLAKQTVDAELARAMRSLASRNLSEHLRRAVEAGVGHRSQEAVTIATPSTEHVRLPASTLTAVRDLVGAENTAAFVAAAAEREVQARTMDGLSGRHHDRTAGDDGADPVAGSSN